MKLESREAGKQRSWEARKLLGKEAGMLEVMEASGCLFSFQASKPPGFLASQHITIFNRWKA
jgi:hypothetical protein